MKEELKKSLQTLPSSALINILKNDYETFGEDGNIKQEFGEVILWVKEKRQVLLEILLERATQ